MTEPLTREELKALMKEAMRESFISLGMDPKDQISLQKDMAFVRSMRLAREKMTLSLWMKALSVLTVAALAVLFAKVGLTPDTGGK